MSICHRRSGRRPRPGSYYVMGKHGRSLWCATDGAELRGH